MCIKRKKEKGKKSKSSKPDDSVFFLSLLENILLFIIHVKIPSWNQQSDYHWMERCSELRRQEMSKIRLATESPLSLYLMHVDHVMTRQ